MWDCLQPAKKLPKIEAYVVAKEDLVNILSSLYDLINSEGLTPKGVFWEHGIWYKPDEVSAFVMPLTTSRDSFLIIIGCNSKQYEPQFIDYNLKHELLHIYNNDWLKFEGGEN